MIRSAVVGSGVVGLMVSVGAVSYHAGTGAPEVRPVAQPEGEMDMDAMMEMMQKMAAPGKHHEKLDYLVGEWNTLSNFPMMGMEPSAGKMTAEWTLGGRFVNFHFKSPNMMGAPFHGIGYTGYNNVTQEYIGVWLDTMNTGIYYHTGDFSSDGKTISMVGESTTPMGPAKMKIVSKLVSDNEFVDTFYDMHGDEWVESGTITYTRVGHGAADD